MPGNIGPLEIAVVLVVVLVVFGPKKLPELGRGLGRGMREFKQGVTGERDRSQGLPGGDLVTSGDEAPTEARREG